MLTKPGELFDRMMWYQAQGSGAALAGAKGREDCPYDEKGNDDERFCWNHWVYGCERALEELRCLNDDIIMFYCFSDYPDEELLKQFSLPTRTAYQLGYWSPRFVPVPKEWGPPRPNECSRALSNPN